MVERRRVSVCLLLPNFYQPYSEDERTLPIIKTEVKKALLEHGDLPVEDRKREGNPRVVLASWVAPEERGEHIWNSHDMMVDATEAYSRQIMNWNYQGGGEIDVNVEGIVGGFPVVPATNNPELEEACFPVQLNDNLIRFQRGIWSELRSHGIRVAYGNWEPTLIFGRNYPNSGVFVNKGKQLLQFPRAIGIHKFAKYVGLVSEYSGLTLSTRDLFPDVPKIHQEYAELEELFRRANI